MRIGVLSPVAHGTGASCISLLLALRLGQGSTDRVCVTHVHPTDSTLRDIGGVGGTTDKTTTPSMIIRTFQSAGALTEQEYAQYCASVTREVDLFTCTRSGEIMCSYEDSRYLANYVMDKFPHKHVVVDVDDHNICAALDVVERSDVVVFVTRVTLSNIEMLKKKLVQYKKQEVLSGKKVIVVFNSYQPEVATQKDLAKMLGVPVKSVYFIPANPYIAWATFNRKVPVLWSFIAKGDHRVSGVRLELDRMVAAIMQKGKTGPLKKKETNLLGVKVAQDETQVSKETKVKELEVTPNAQEYAELMHGVDSRPTQQRKQHGMEGMSGNFVGFGVHAQSGFMTQVQSGFGEFPKPQSEAVLSELQRDTIQTGWAEMDTPHAAFPKMANGIQPHNFGQTIPQRSVEREPDIVEAQGTVVQSRPVARKRSGFKSNT